LKSVIKSAGKQVSARVVGLDRKTDITVLKAEKKMASHFPFRKQLRPGQPVPAFGSPFGLDNSVTMGCGQPGAAPGPMIYVQPDASINPGSSGARWWMRKM
jgi:serine protease Do